MDWFITVSAPPSFLVDEVCCTIFLDEFPFGFDDSAPRLNTKDFCFGECFPILRAGEESYSALGCKFSDLSLIMGLARRVLFFGGLA